MSGKEAFFKTFGEKEKNADYQHFLLFPSRFSIPSQTEMIIYVTFILSSANAFNLDKIKFFVVWEWAKSW